MYGYKCTLQTDTEVITYAVDLLMRRQRLPIELVARILSPPIWNAIDRMGEKERSIARTLRMVYGPLLMNGPFTIIIAHHGEMIGLTDRVRLRPLTAAAGDDTLLGGGAHPADLPQLDECGPQRGRTGSGQIRC